METLPQILWKCPLFASLEEAQKISLARDLKWNCKQWNTDVLVAQAGDPVERLMILIGGELSAQMPHGSGKVLKVETLKAPSLVAGGLLFSSDNRLPVQLVAQSPATILSLSKKAAIRMFSRYPEMMESFLSDLGDKIAFLAEKLRIQQFQSLRQKIAGYFLKLYRLGRDPQIRLGYSLDTLADLFGVSRPSLSRSLSGLGEEGALERLAKGQYRIHPNALQEILTED